MDMYRPKIVLTILPKADKSLYGFYSHPERFSSTR